ncbi:hypothetical protein LEP1GSC070_3915 [Leptospira santarosai str. AIM]|nr:hypothetical protein LEP1GSC070_3915 [Leptospira santarosai str. AIM]
MGQNLIPKPQKRSIVGGFPRAAFGNFRSTIFCPEFYFGRFLILYKDTVVSIVFLLRSEMVGKEPFLGF